MGHPKGLYLLSSTVMLECFSYYIFAGVLVMYMIDVLHFSSAFSTYIYGIALGSTYFFQILGGYLCDNYLGNRKCIIIGAIFISISLLIFTYDASLYQLARNVHSHSTLLFTYPEIIFLIGASVMAIGASFFKVSIASFISLFYDYDDDRVDSAFSIYYMFINIGAFFAPLAINFIVGVHHPELYQYGFLAGFIAIFLALVIFVMLKDKLLSSPEGEPIGVLPLSKLHKINENANNISEKLSKIDMHRLVLIFFIFLIVITYYAANQQIFTSIIIFAEAHVNNILPLLNIKLAPSFFLSLNPLFIIILSPVLIKLTDILSKRNRGISSITKLGIGLIFLCLAFLSLDVAIFASGKGSISILWIAIFSFLLVNSELLIMPVALSLVSKLAPPKYTSTLIGLYYVTIGIATMLAGILASAFPIHHATTLFGFIPIANIPLFFMIFVLSGLVFGVIWLVFINKIKALAHGIS